ncbi:hypothetical protein [Sessilibacter corallicola]|uniref:hypothetical protein n=1 Tax=Sessilibacter corallicola TaxID=2904075 RepID=UPI001E5002F5|nr:hypothetical protein [Sessilibacter corallicola]MCE2029564.1 hypothetical protein [Sessilibacter corallicola]
MPHLKDGSDYQMNRYIVGDESGLKNLIKACEIAIEKGECINLDLDGFEGVAKYDAKFLKDNQESQSTPFILGALSVILMFILFLVLLGFINFLAWF